MAVVGVSKINNSLYSSLKESTVHGCALHKCKDTLDCEEHKQRMQPFSFSCVLVVCSQLGSYRHQLWVDLLFSVKPQDDYVDLKIAPDPQSTRLR